MAAYRRGAAPGPGPGVAEGANERPPEGRHTLPGLSRYLNRPDTGVPGLRRAVTRLQYNTRAVSSTLNM